MSPSQIDRDSCQPILIIGYGNLLRCDDGIGQYIAKAIANWQMPCIDVISTHQLKPEFVENLSKVNYAIFVDGYIANQNKKILIYPLSIDSIKEYPSHWCTPHTLLAITRELYCDYPKAWHIMVPGIDFSFGETLSLNTKRQISITLQKIKSLIQLEIINHA